MRGTILGAVLGSCIGTAPMPAAALAAPNVSDAESMDERVEVRVLSVVPGGSDAAVVRVDQGTAAGLRPGDRVTFLPIGLAPVQGTVLEAESREATVDVPQRAQDLGVGVPGEVLVPTERLATPKPPGAENRPPIEWESEETGWEDDTPLLAEARVRTRAERDPVWYGRAYVSGDWIRDRVGAGRDDHIYRVGVDARAANLFGYGGELRIDGEFNARETVVPDGQGESESLGRIDRLSYTLGGGREAARRVEVGRFLPHLFPELGITDGAEVAYRTGGGHRFGATFGFLPTRDRERSTGDTLQVSSWANFALDPDERLQVGGAVQKTWHEGDADRDLLLTRLRWYPGGDWSANATAWFDRYGASDGPKDEGVELTQALASVSRRFGADAALTVSASQVRYPYLLRDQVQTLPDDIFRDGYSRRFTLSGWKRVSDDHRLRARLDQWSDQDAAGLGGELGWERTFRGHRFDRVDVAVSSRPGRFTDVYGLRAGTGGPALGGRWRAHLDVGVYDQIGFVGDQEELLQNALRLGWDGALAEDWFLSLTASYRFGDEQDAVALGFLLQRSF